MSFLERKGAINVNLVGGDPIPHIHVILEALTIADVRIPIIFNSNLYLTEEAMRLIVHVVDLFLPDFKYGNDSCASKLSLAPNYWEVLTRNLLTVRKEGRETIIRHLVLPGHLKCCTEKVLRWISENFPEALVNVMGQYRPEYRVEREKGEWGSLERPLSLDEYREALHVARKYGLTLI